MELGVFNDYLLFLAGSMREQIKLNQIIVKPNSMNPFGKNHFASSRHHQLLSGC